MPWVLLIRTNYLRWLLAFGYLARVSFGIAVATVRMRQDLWALATGVSHREARAKFYHWLATFRADAQPKPVVSQFEILYFARFKGFAYLSLFRINLFNEPDWHKIRLIY